MVYKYDILIISFSRKFVRRLNLLHRAVYENTMVGMKATYKLCADSKLRILLPTSLISLNHEAPARGPPLPPEARGRRTEAAASLALRNKNRGWREQVQKRSQRDANKSFKGTSHAVRWPGT